MQPRIQYVRSADGTNIAYSAIGEGQPLIFSPNIWSHLEVQLSGEFGEAFQRLAQEGLLVVAYDMRGMGMSDRDVDDFSLDSQLGDIEALRERLGLDRFALYGNVFASLASIAYAAARRERVSHLILNLPFANGEDWYQAMPTLHGLEKFRIMAKHHWEAYTLTHAMALLGLLPGADPRSLAALMRECTTPDTFSRYLTEVRTQDVRSLLAKVSAPSLILSPTSGGPVIVEAGRFAREVAAGIPDARLVGHEASFGRPGLQTTRLAAEFVLGRMIEWSAPPADAYPDPEPRGRVAGLSSREIEVLRLLAAGRSSREIGAELVLAVRTVERHIASIYRKIDAHNRAQATAFALQHGLVERS